MVTKYTDEKFIAIAAPRSGKTWEMLIRANAKNGVIIVRNEERKLWLEEMAKHIGLPKPNVVVWMQSEKPDVKKDAGLVVVDDYPIYQLPRACGKPKMRAIKVLNEIEERLKKQNPYPCAEITLIDQERRRLMLGEW